MFILFSQLITQANLSGMHLMIRPAGEGRLDVIVCTESTDFRASDPALKAALAQPLSVQGAVTDIDTLLTDSLSAFCTSYQQANSVCNVDKVVAGHSSASEAVQAKKAENSSTTSPEPDSEAQVAAEDEQDADPELF